MDYRRFSIGLTGGIGSGKSLVAGMFSELGASVIDADHVARKLTLPGGEGIEPIRKQFGERFIDAAGALDRAMMREHVFANPDERKKLEAILHPLIREVSLRLAEKAEGDYVIFENPLLADLPAVWKGMGTRVLVVDCPEEVQIARVMKRNGLTAEQVKAIMAAQTSRQKRLAIADDVIENDKGTDYTALKVRELHQIYQKMAVKNSK